MNFIVREIKVIYLNFCHLKKNILSPLFLPFCANQPPNAHAPRLCGGHKHQFCSGFCVCLCLCVAALVLECKASCLQSESLTSSGCLLRS
jgi:hypothetical protein